MKTEKSEKELTEKADDLYEIMYSVFCRGARTSAEEYVKFLASYREACQLFGLPFSLGFATLRELPEYADASDDLCVAYLALAETSTF